jgi:hypothetical protein
MDAAAKTRGSIWFIGLTVITVGWYSFFGALVVIDAGVSPLEAVHLVGAILCTGIVVAGLLPQLVAPARHVAAFQQACMAGVALLAAAAIFGDPDNHGGQAGFFDPVYLTFLLPLLILAVLHPARRQLLRAGDVRPLLLLLTAAMAIPLAVYGIDQGLIQRNSWPPSADPHHNSHWFMMAELAFAIPLVTAVAGLGARGWRLPAWTASLALAAFGAVSALFPHAPSSVGVGWGLLVVLAAATVAAVPLREPRRGHLQAAQTPTQRAT